MFRNHAVPLLIASSLMTSACTGVVTSPHFVGGPPLPLSPGSNGPASVRYVSAEIGPAALRSHVYLRDPVFESASRDTTERFMTHEAMKRELAEDLAGEVQEELRACARGGGRTLDVVIRVEDIAYAGYEEQTEGADRMMAVAEFFEADGSGPIARYPVEAVSPRRFSAEAFHGAEGVSVSINDREDSMGEWLGRELCRRTFGSEVRPSRWRNLTT